MLFGRAHGPRLYCSIRNGAYESSHNDKHSVTEAIDEI